MVAASPPKKVTFLIVPGSFSTPPAYDLLVHHLQHARGYPARALALLSANDGTRQPPATGADDAAHLRREILSVLDGDNDSEGEEATDVVLAVHSYGGIPGTSALRGLGRADRAAQGKRTAVVGLVYVASFVLPRGQSLRGCMIGPEVKTEAEASDDVASAPAPEPVRIGVPGGYLPALDRSVLEAIFSDMLPSGEKEKEGGQDVIAKYAGTFTRHSSDSFDYAVEYEAWRDVPSVYLIPGDDVVVPTAAQLAMFEHAVAAGGQITKVLVPGAGHALNVSRMELVADEMVKLAEAAQS